MALTTVSRTLVESAAADAEAEVRDDYSGRGMYGERCFGIVCDGPSAYGRFLIVVAQENHNLAERLARAVSQDSMGLQSIYYFPRFALDGDFPDDEEDGE